MLVLLAALLGAIWMQDETNAKSIAVTKGRVGVFAMVGKLN